MPGREDQMYGARPAVAGGRVLLTSAEVFEGYEIVEYRGIVWGSGRDSAPDVPSRQHAVELMIEMAARQRANGVLGVRFDRGAAPGEGPVAAYGTAVVLRPVPRYVPRGALGSIVSTIADLLATKTP